MEDDLLDEIIGTNINNQKNNDFCCICGCSYLNHIDKRHHFFKALPEHKCIKCNRYFFEHDHYKEICFKPLKYLEYTNYNYH